MLRTVLFALLASSTFAAEWENLDEAHYVCGRKCSNGYLQGKVVLVYRDREFASRMEEIWTSFKAKPFVLIGSYEGNAGDVSHPVYRDVQLKGNPCSEPIFIVDAKGKRRFRGKDDRRATESLVSLLTDYESPKNEKQWRQYLEYELENLPAHGHLRYEAFKKQFPSAAKEYAKKYGEISKIPQIDDLVKLVKFAKAVKDHREVNPMKAKKINPKIAVRIDAALEKYAPLKDSENPLVVREAKNALADLKWAKAAL